MAKVILSIIFYNEHIVFHRAILSDAPCIYLQNKITVKEFKKHFEILVLYLKELFKKDFLALHIYLKLPGYEGNKLRKQNDI